MPEGERRLRAAIDVLLQGKQDRPALYPALLGAYVDGVQQLRVANRPDFVWCRMRGATSEIIQAFNDVVGLHWDLPILVYRDPNAPNVWRIYGRDIRQYNDWQGASYLPPHGDSHSFSGAPRTGVDPVWVFKRQYMPLLPRPVSSGTMGIFVEPDFYYWENSYHWWPGSGTASLASHAPTGAMNGRFVTVFMNGALGILQTIDGNEFSAWTPPADPGTFIALPDPSIGIPIAAAFLTTGTTTIGWGELYDLRMPAQSLAAELQIRDEAVPKGQATILDFVGPGVTATVSGSYASVVIPGGGGGGPAVLGPGTGSAYYMRVGQPVGIGGLNYQVPDPPYVSGSLMLFINGLGQRIGVDYTETNGGSGSFALADTPPTGASLEVIWGKLVEGGAIASGTVQLWNQSQPLGSVDILDFVGPNVLATISGAYGRVFITGSPAVVLTPLTGTVVVADEGVVLGSAPELDFRGAGVQASLVGGIASVVVPGPGVDQIGVAVQNQGVPLGTGTTLNFIGPNVSTTMSGTVARVYISGAQGGGGSPGVDQIGVYGLANGVPLGTGTSLDAGNNLTMTLSGTRLRLDAAALPAVPVTGSVAVRDEASPIGQATILDFVGAGVTATMSGSYAQVNIPGAAGVGIQGLMGWDEGAPVGTGTIINAIGAGITMTLSGTVLQLNVPGGANPPISGTFVGMDKGQVLGSFAALDVGYGLDMFATGGYAVIAPDYLDDNAYHLNSGTTSMYTALHAPRGYGGTNAPLVANQLYGYPFTVGRLTWVNQLMVEETSGGNPTGTVLEMGIYASKDGQIPPSVLITACGQQVGVSNAKMTFAISPPIPLTPGRVYWIAVASNLAPSVWSFDVNGTINGILGFDLNNARAAVVGWLRSLTVVPGVNSLPLNWPAAGNSSLQNDGKQPALFYRCA